MLKILIIMLFVYSSFCVYQKQWSKTLNCYSAITHCTQNQIVQWSCKICKECEKLKNINYIQYELASVMGYVGYMASKNIILVVMRGTKDYRNWLEDFSFKFVSYSPCQGCKIHQGFYLDYLIVQNNFNNVVKDLMTRYPTANIVVTGSSLGGALATVAAIQMQLRFGKVIELHAFGCPRVGNINLAQFLTSKIPTIYRVIHNKDIVPHVPLQSQNYHHPAFQILYDSQMNNYKQCDSSGEDPYCSDSYYPNYSTSDHTSYWYKPIEEDVCTP